MNDYAKRKKLHKDKLHSILCAFTTCTGMTILAQCDRVTEKNTSSFAECTASPDAKGTYSERRIHSHSPMCRNRKQCGENSSGK